MQIDSYLQRINYTGSLQSNQRMLRDPHNAHLLTVLFENLSIHCAELIQSDNEALFKKIVLRQRGGFCYELNGLFADLLRTLGFEVTMLSASVARSDGTFGPNFDHLTLMVHLSADPQPARHWLADVGFGDSFRPSLCLDTQETPIRDKGIDRFSSENDQITLLTRTADGWQAQYRFTLQAHQHAEFADMGHCHQTSPASSFTQKRICMIATVHSRVTLSNQRLIITEHSQRSEQTLSESEYMVPLPRYFGSDFALSGHCIDNA